ncbi:MAG: hypothetical protein ACOYX1_03050 [Acidobacteriota bacterium]
MLFEGELEEPLHRSSLSTAWLPVSAALLLAACFSLLLVQWLLAGLWSMPEALLRAVIAVALSVEAIRITARAASAVCIGYRRSEGAACLLLAAAGAWIVPLGALAGTGHPLLLPGCAAAGFAAGRALRRIFPAESESTEQPGWPPRGFLFIDEAAPRPRRPASPWMSAGLLHAGILAALVGWPGAGALAAAAGALGAGFCWASAESGRSPRIWGARAVAAASASAAVLAALLIVVKVPERDAGGWHPPSSNAKRSGGYSDPNLLSGAVLIAPAPKSSRLQSPVPPPAQHGARSRFLRRMPPLTEIPFSGVYWVLPGAAMQPPASSLIVRDTPLGWQFENVDRQPIWMKAVQELPWPVKPDCCTALEITVTNADRIEGTVALEVLLISRHAGRRRRASLGLQPVARAGRTLLRFPWDSGSLQADVEELVVDFHLAGRRIYRSAQVAIESFRFVR